MNDYLQGTRVGDLRWTRSKVGLSLVVAVGGLTFLSFRHGGKVSGKGVEKRREGRTRTLGITTNSEPFIQRA